MSYLFIYNFFLTFVAEQFDFKPKSLKRVIGLSDVFNNKDFYSAHGGIHIKWLNIIFLGHSISRTES